MLKQTGGNKSCAAEVLQVSYKTLLTKIKDYKLEEKGDYRANSRRKNDEAERTEKTLCIPSLSGNPETIQGRVSGSKVELARRGEPVRERFRPPAEAGAMEEDIGEMKS